MTALGFHTATYTDTGTKASQNVDSSIVPFNMSLAVTLASTGSYKIQFSLDPFDVADASALWFDSVNFPASTAASILSNVNFPVSRYRIIIAANGSSITVQSQQGISTN